MSDKLKIKKLIPKKIKPIKEINNSQTTVEASEPDIFTTIPKGQPKTNVEFAINITNFTKTFKGFFKKPFTAVDNVTIKVRKGTIHGFIGPNGSGKTTTIKCLVSAIKPTSGTLLINDLKYDSIPAKRAIGYIPESARFPQTITTFEYLISMGQVSGLKYKDAKVKSEAILKDLNLWKFKKRNPNSYSSGMKKKVLLAQSLLNNPDILILDEPAANLDPTARTELFNDLRKLRDQGKTVFISSHILSELQHLVDEVTILNYSKVVFSGAIKSANNDQYEFVTSNNAELLKILKKHKYNAELQESGVIIKIDDEADIKHIWKLVLASDLKVESYSHYIIDLQKMYQKIIMDLNQKAPDKELKKGKEKK